MPEVVWEPSPGVLGSRAGRGLHAPARLRRLPHVPAALPGTTPSGSGPRPSRTWVSSFVPRGHQVLGASRGPEWATWFTGSTLNVGWNCVHRWADQRPDEEAAVFGARTANAARSPSALSPGRSRATPRLSSGSASARGDAVALYLPMSLEVLIASNACAHIGAIQVPIFSSFAAPAVAARLADSEARVVVTADGSYRRGREVPMEIVGEAAGAAPSVPATSSSASTRRLETPMTAGRDLTWDEAVDGCPGEAEGRPGSTPRRPTSSRTRQERPASRRACSIPGAASSSRSHARSPTRPTPALTTRSSSRPTWAGSWGPGWSSAAGQSARGSSSWKAPRISRQTGFGGSSRRSAPRSIGCSPTR